MNETKIYGGVPIPVQRVGAPTKYPFNDMQPGQHFCWMCAPGESVKSRRSSISTAARLRGFHVSTRSDGNMVRCWMVGRIDGKTE